MFSVCREFMALRKLLVAPATCGPMKQFHFFVLAIMDAWWHLSSQFNQLVTDPVDLAWCLPMG